MIQTLVTNAKVEIWEFVIHKFTNQGGGFSRRGDVSHEAHSPTDAEWNAMSYTQRKEYSEAASVRAAQNGSRRR